MITYKDAGVDISEATKAVNLIKPIVASTRKKGFADQGLFGGMFDASILKGYQHPILVSSVDGVGTKTIFSQVMNQWTTGQCIVNHCANDLLTTGAQPLFIQNYQGFNKLDTETVEEIVKNMAIACKTMDIEISGGEIAEMHSIYKKDRVDIACTIVGVVEKSKIIDGKKIQPHDVLIGLPSSGIHTNGFTLAHKVFSLGKYDYITDDYFKELGCTLGEEYLKIHKEYVTGVQSCLEQGIDIHGIAHITGGGFFDNIERILPKNLYAYIGTPWNILPIFKLIQSLGNVSEQEMFHVFNMGIGMILIVHRTQAEKIENVLREYKIDPVIIGSIKTKVPKQKENVVINI